MPTYEQRQEYERINKLAFKLCEQWQRENPRQHGYSIDEISAFMAGVVAASAQSWPNTATSPAR